MPEITRIAVLDDYKDHARPAFAALDPAKYDVAYFPDTLLPYSHPATSQDEKDKLAARLEPFDIISTMRERTPFPAELVHRLPNLKLLLTTGTRNLGLDLDAFKQRNIPVAGALAKDVPPGQRAPPGIPDSTTQHFVTLLLAAARNIPMDDLAVKTGGWQTGLPPFGLGGKTYASLGLGRLGAATAKLLFLAFGMRVVAWSENLTQAKADAAAESVGLPAGTFTAVSRHDLFATADVLAVHLVLSDRTRGLVTKADLELMKQDSIFVNTSRGPIVNEADLLDVLRRGRINRAALDVFDIEPLPQGSPWRTMEWGRNGRSQVVLTPHMGYGEDSTMNAWYKVQVDNIHRFERGEPLDFKM